MRDEASVLMDSTSVRRRSASTNGGGRLAQTIKGSSVVPAKARAAVGLDHLAYANGMIRRLIFTLVLSCAVVFPAAVAAREPYATFYTPGKAVLCSSLVDLTGDNRSFVPSLFCWTPNDGFNIALSASRRPRASTQKAYKWHYEPGGRPLGFGQAWWINREGVQGLGRGGVGDVLIRCVSRTNGLTCTNRAGHGFWLGRFRGYRLF
jgi:hypothetical protein